MPHLPVTPPDDLRLSVLQQHARALGLVLRIEVVPDVDAPPQPDTADGGSGGRGWDRQSLIDLAEDLESAGPNHEKRGANGPQIRALLAEVAKLTDELAEARAEADRLRRERDTPTACPRCGQRHGARSSLCNTHLPGVFTRPETAGEADVTTREETDR